MTEKIEAEDDSAQAEFAAIAAVHEALRPLSSDGRQRVLDYISSLLGLGAPRARDEVAGEEEIAPAEEAAEAAPTLYLCGAVRRRGPWHPRGKGPGRGLLAPGLRGGRSLHGPPGE